MTEYDRPDDMTETPLGGRREGRRRGTRCP